MAPLLGWRLGAIQTLPGLGLSRAKIANRVIYGNGHARNMVSLAGAYLEGIGVRPSLACPTINSYGSGGMSGQWRFFTQLLHRKRGVLSDLSPCSPWSNNMTAGNISLNVNILTEISYGFLHTRDPCDYVRIWAQRKNTAIKLVKQIPISATDNTTEIDISNFNFDAITGADQVISVYGDPYRPISAGYGMFPACEHLASYAGRLWGLGQANYSHPGAKITVTKYDELTADEKKFLNGYLSSRVGTGYEVRRAKVQLTPIATNVRWTKIWDETSTPASPNEDTYIAVSESGESLFFVIDGIVVARFTQDGAIYLKGTLTEQTGSPSPPSRTGQIEWDSSNYAILVNINAGTQAVPSWEGAIIIDWQGNMTFARKTSLAEYTPPAIGFGLPPGGVANIFGIADNIPDPILDTSSEFPPGVPMTQWFSGFLPLMTGNIYSYGGTDYYYFKAYGYYMWSTSQSKGWLACTTLIQNASLAYLRDYPLFNHAGFMYKNLVVGKVSEARKNVGWIWDVYDPLSFDLTLWLADDVPDSFEASDWEIVGQSCAYYSKHGYPEGGYFGEALSQLGFGTILYSEFDPEDKLTPMGLNVTPYGLEFLFREKSYLVRTASIHTPIDNIDIQKLPDKSRVYAKRSIAEDRKERRLSLIAKPKAIALTEAGSTVPLTDAAGNRLALAKDINQETARDACGAFYSDDKGDRYILAGLDRYPDTPGGRKHALALDVRGDAYHVTRLDGMEVTALAVIEGDDGDERLIWGDSTGRLGYWLVDSSDFGDPIPWYTRLYVNHVDFQIFTITGLRMFAQGPLSADGQKRPYIVKLRVYAVATTNRDDLQTLDLASTFKSRQADFDQNALDEGKYMPLTKPITSNAFVLEIAGNDDSAGLHRFRIALKGPELQLKISGEVEAVRR